MGLATTEPWLRHAEEASGKAPAMAWQACRCFHELQESRLPTQHPQRCGQRSMRSKGETGGI